MASPLDPSQFIQGAVARTGVVIEPLLVNGTVGLGGPGAKDFTRLCQPCMVNGTLHAERVRFERGVQIQGRAEFTDVKIEGPCASAGQLMAKESVFQGDLYCMAGGYLTLTKCRVQDIRVEPPVYRHRFLKFFARWIGKAKIVLENTVARNVIVAEGARVVVVLKGTGALIGKISGQGTIQDRREKKVAAKAKASK